MARTRMKSRQVTHLLEETGGVIRPLYDKLAETVSVKDFGAVGDGVTDDTAAINAALAASHQKIVFPSGNYLITAPLVTSSYQTLEGTGATIVMADTVFSNILNIANATKVTVDGLYLVGHNTGNSVDIAIQIVNSHEVTITNCLIKDIGQEAASPNEWGHGIEIDGSSTNVKIVNNKIQNIKGYGNVRGDGITVRTCSNVLIQGNTIDTCRRMQIAIIDNAVDIKIIGNDLINGYLTAIDVEPNSIGTTGEIIISSNNIRNFGSKPAATIGIQYYGIDNHQNSREDITISNNIITAENAQAASCIYAQNGAKFTHIIGNTLKCDGFCNGIALSSGSGSVDTVISNNIIIEPETYGIQGYRNEGISITGNYLKSTNNTVSHGIFLTSGYNDLYPVIDGNTFDMVGTAIAAGIYLQAANRFTISDNRIFVSQGNGIEIYSNYAATDAGTVVGNTCVDTGTGATAYYFRAAGAGSLQNLMFRSNSQTGFTNPYLTSGGVGFAQEIRGVDSAGSTGATTTANGTVAVTINGTVFYLLKAATA